MQDHKTMNRALFGQDLKEGRTLYVYNIPNHAAPHLRDTGGIIYSADPADGFTAHVCVASREPPAEARQKFADRKKALQAFVYAARGRKHLPVVDIVK